PAEPATPAEPAEPANPLISWAPSGGAAGTPTPGAPLVGWQVPDNAARPSPIAGFALGGVGARLVAYLIDGILLSVTVTVIQSIVAPDFMPFDLSAGSIDQLPTPIFSLETVLVGVIGMGVDFIYLVGLWTSRGRATVGMRLLKLQVVDMASGKGLTISQAAARWLLLSGAIGIIGLIPVDLGLAGLIGFIWLIVLFVTTSSHPLKQGIHDRAANSIVVQPTGTSSNTAVVGCLLLVVLFVVIPIVALVALGPQIEQILSEVGQSI
ncbi:MAG: RDD family protein, partial [Candidatus Limnocylindrales bacterium]